MTEAEASFEAAWAVVDELVRFGMEHACVSPGSRSTPVALAVSRHPNVRVHVHLDERASAFFALGIAKATGRPIAVVTTSGTAVAELFPAVVEASMSHALLVLLTADRPPELRGVGANQTIDQRGIFGTYVRASVEPASDHPPAPEAWRALVERATLAALGPPPGPVHVNLPFREPLVPETATLPVASPVGPPPRTIVPPEPDEVDALRRELGSTDRGAVLVGSMVEGSVSARSQPPFLLELADRLSWPVLAEPTSGLRVPGTLAAGQFLLADETFIDAHRPELVLQVGAAPTSRAGLELVRQTPRLMIVDPDHVVGDPHRRAERTLAAEAWVVASEVLDGLDPVAETPWLRSWRQADALARRAVDGLMDGWDAPSEARVARDVAASLPDGSALVVGSSMPVRDLDASMIPRSGIVVLANRGASGIDGFVSTALGVAASGRPTTALCGDLTLLHDAGSLLWSARRGLDAVFVVPNNDGGAIFSFLDQRRLAELDELFTTPHGLDLGAVCAAAGAGHVRVTRAGDLIPVIAEARAACGVHVVEVPTDRDDEVRRHGEIRDAVASALGGIPA